MDVTVVAGPWTQAPSILLYISKRSFQAEGIKASAALFLVWRRKPKKLQTPLAIADIKVDHQEALKVRSKATAETDVENKQSLRKTTTE
jgi:hypothetical protein